MNSTPSKNKPASTMPLTKSVSRETFSETSMARNQNHDEAPRFVTIHLSQIEPNPYQPRQTFDETELQELADSIAEHGLLQAPVVRQNPDNRSTFQIIAGERRVRAARLLGLETVLCVVRVASDLEMANLAIVENRDRAAVNPIEEARAYKNLVETFGAKVKDIGAQNGKSRSAISNAMRLLQLPESVQAMIADGHLSVGHGRALLAWLEFPEVLNTLAQFAVENATPTKTLEAGIGKWNWEILSALRKANAMIALPWSRDGEFEVCDSCPFGALRKAQSGEAMCLKIEHYRELATARKKRLDQEKSERQKVSQGAGHTQTSPAQVQARRVAERDARVANNARMRDEILQRFSHLRRTVPGKALDEVHALLALSASAMFNGYGLEYYENLCADLNFGRCSLAATDRDSVSRWCEAMEGLDLLLLITWRQVEHNVSQFGSGETGARLLELLPAPRESEFCESQLCESELCESERQVLAGGDS